MHPSADSPDASRENTALAGMACGLADALVCLFSFSMATSTVLLADFLKTFLEFLAVLLSWLATRQVVRGHHAYDYGMHKLESLISLSVGTLMLICLAAIGASAALRFHDPEPVTGAGVWISLATEVAYGVINSFFVIRYRREASQGSPLAAAQASLFLSRLASNFFIFGAMAGGQVFSGQTWALYIDPVASLVIAVSILLAAAGVFRASFPDLMDRALEESDQLLIMRELAAHYDLFRNFHHVRSRRAGGRAFIELFLEFPPEQTVAEAMESARRIKAAVEGAVARSRVTIGLAGHEEEGASIRAS